MTKQSKPQLIKWLKDVAAHDYDAAQAYLSLRFDAQKAEVLIRDLKESEPTERRVNDILRASNRPALPINDPGVLRDLKKVLLGERLSPILVVSFPNGCDIADGYHRVSLLANLDPFGTIPLRIASL